MEANEQQSVFPVVLLVLGFALAIVAIVTVPSLFSHDAATAWSVFVGSLIASLGSLFIARKSIHIK
ncbi:hypothetical protein [Corynebacterium sp. sy039]|uniref:hypothetical protein n=1 Tax=Corynebacterium sp. sy039 TaxID=2599641 RepID=UPI0011B4ECA7|nr:hypothetical protein [Corynebacterium sp. sy039]QDZ41831.1 hypothetical protein FQV43_00595 [Corynebacterium sp. sy039]